MVDEVKNVWDVALSVTAVLGGGLAACFTVYEFVKTQRWQRAQACLDHVTKLVDQEVVRSVLRVIDWSNVGWPFEPVQGAPSVASDDVLVRALRVHREGDQFRLHEVVVRDAFDRFFDALERVHRLVDARLLEADDLRPYFGYWARLLHADMDSRGRAELRGALAAYCGAYGYARAWALMRTIAVADRPSAQGQPAAHSASRIG